MKNSVQLIVLVAMALALAACGKNKKSNAGNGNGSNNTKCLTGAACKPSGTIEVSVEADLMVKIEEGLITIADFAGKTQQRKVGDVTYQCGIRPISSTQISFEVDEDKLLINEKRILTRESGTSGELWGTWREKDEKDKGVIYRAFVTFFEKDQDRMLIKLHCFHPKK